MFSGGRILGPDNFRRLTEYGRKGFCEMRLWRQDKENAAEVAAFVAAAGKGGLTPLPFEGVVEMIRTAFDVARMREEGVVRS